AIIPTISLWCSSPAAIISARESRRIAERTSADRETIEMDFVLPAKAGTHNPGRLLLEEGLCRQRSIERPRRMGPGLRRDDGNCHTAILRCRTGAPTVRLSAASM